MPHPVVPERGNGITVAWAAVALACVATLMWAGFSTRGNDRLAELVFGSLSYVVYFLLLVAIANVCVEIWWRARWYVRYIADQRERWRTAYALALLKSKDLPGADPNKLARQIFDGKFSDI